MKKILHILFIAFIISSCDMGMDEINTNPDVSMVVPPRFLASRAILNMTANSTGKGFLTDTWFMKSIASNELAQSHMYNSLDNGSLGYGSLIEPKKMVELADADDTMADEEKNAYRALDRFTQAWIFYNATMQMGDVPCSEAVQGEEGTLRPAYDTQEEVFNTIIKLLDEAGSLFAKAGTFRGDPVYSGNPELWAKTVNGFMLCVLNHLSSKQNVGDIDVKKKFEEVAARSLYTGFAEDFQRVYSNKANQYYPFHKLNHNYTQYMFLQEFIVDLLKQYGDRRLFYFAEPATSLTVAGKAENDFDAYSGVDGTQQFSDVVKETNAGRHSRLNLRYSQDPVCEPVKKLSYAEIQFIMAEAALRGWTTPKNANEHYNEAVKASMQFTAKYTLDAYRHGIVIDDAYINDYLAGDANFSIASNKLQLIMEQKYLSSFMHGSWYAYFDYRRTGFPEIPINPETSMNVDHKDRMPVRWTYPGNEYSTNNDNMMIAIKRLFGGTVETMNDVMWILKD